MKIKLVYGRAKLNERKNYGESLNSWETEDEIKKRVSFSAPFCKSRLQSSIREIVSQLIITSTISLAIRKQNYYQTRWCRVDHDGVREREKKVSVRMCVRVPVWRMVGWISYSTKLSFQCLGLLRDQGWRHFIKNSFRQVPLYTTRSTTRQQIVCRLSGQRSMEVQAAGWGGGVMGDRLNCPLHVINVSLTVFRFYHLPSSRQINVIGPLPYVSSTSGLVTLRTQWVAGRWRSCLASLANRVSTARTTTTTACLTVYVVVKLCAFSLIFSEGNYLERQVFFFNFKSN